MNKKNKVRIKFVGENSTHVTGSCVLIETNNKKILVECGLYQGEGTLLQEYRINNARFSFKPKDIDYVIINHSHMDHVGLIPRLYKEGCTAKIIAPKGLKDLFEVMCKDSAFIMERDAEDLTKRCKRTVTSIYDTAHVMLALSYWNEFTKDEEHEIDKDIKIRYTNSGHIINGCQCELWIKNSNRTVKIGVTSDLGNTCVNQYYVDNFKKIEKANLLIGECTYSNKTRQCSSKDRKKDLEKIETVIEQVCLDNKGKLLIPVFALQRCQSMLTYIYDIFGKDENFDVPIIIDSALALKINEIFKRELKGDQKDKFLEAISWKNIKLLKEFTETEKWAKGDVPCVFLSCGGMLQAGRSVYIASKLLPSSKNHIMFCGYSSTNSLATKIKNKKQKTIAIDGKAVPCRCGVTILNSMSSHMQRNELLDYYSGGNFDKVALVHSNFDDKLEFSKELQEKVSKRNKTSKIIVVNKSTEILL